MLPSILGQPSALFSTPNYPPSGPNSVTPNPSIPQPIAANSPALSTSSKRKGSQAGEEGSAAKKRKGKAKAKEEGSGGDESDEDGKGEGKKKRNRMALSCKECKVSSIVLHLVQNRPVELTNRFVSKLSQRRKIKVSRLSSRRDARIVS